MDIRRFGAHHRSPRHTLARVCAVYETYYDIKYPHHERSAGRPLRVPPAYGWHREHGAAFGEKSGWERVNWYETNAPEGDESRRPRGWAGRHWSPAIGAEHRACREAAALFDETSFAKIEVSGAGAAELLERLCDNRVEVFGEWVEGEVAAEPLFDPRGPASAAAKIASRMSTADTKVLIEEAVASIQKEVPALQKLKLVIELELRGRGDIQLFRVQVPGPKITRDIASDAKVRLSVPRSHFNELAKEGKIRHWREAFESGHVKATGPSEILKLIQSVIERQEERSRTRKLRTK